MSALNFHFVAQMSVERLLNCVLEGMVIALFAWLLLRVIGRRNSGTRFAVWFCALVAIVVAPFLGTPARGATAVLHPAAAIVMPRAWSLYLFSAWAAIALIGLARVLAGVWHLHTIRRSCVPVNAMDPAVSGALDESRRRIELCASDMVRVPTAIGLLKPAVVIPSWAWRELSPAELNAVILHELAHLRRWDDWTNLAQKVLSALFFFHPAVWWVESRLSLEREMACDDLVLARTANPRAYAECLVSLAEKNLLQRGVALAQAVVGRVRQTSLRVLQILDAQRTHAIGVWKPAPWVVAGFSVVCLVSAAHAPRLVAFGDPATTAPAPSSPAAIATLANDTPTYAAPVVAASYVAPASGGELLNGKARARNAAAHRGQVLRSMASAQPGTLKGKADGFALTQSAPAVHQAKHQEQHIAAGQLVRTVSPERIPFVIVQQAAFVFMQDHSASDSEPVLWHVTVWRFTVLPQAPALPVSSKST